MKMEKKKYEAPVTEVVKVETECLLAALSSWAAGEGEGGDIIEGNPGEGEGEYDPENPTTGAKSYSPWS